MLKLSNERIQKVLKHLDPYSTDVDKISRIESSAIELCVYGMMHVDENSFTLSTNSEPEFYDLILMHRPNDGEENVALFEFENCTNTALLNSIESMLTDWLDIVSDYVDGR